MNELPDRDDPIAALAAAWRRVEPEDPTAAVAAPDVETRAVADWLAALWREAALRLPRARIPWRLRLRVEAPRLRVAAALLFGAWLLFLDRGPASRPAPERSRGDSIAPLPVALRDPPAVAPPTGGPPQGPPSATATLAAEPPRILLLAPDRTEMRHGAVRLILFENKVAASVAPGREPAPPPDDSPNHERNRSEELRR